MTKDDFILRLRHGLKGKPKKVAELIELEINRITRMKSAEFDQYVLDTTGIPNSKPKPKPVVVEPPANSSWLGGRILKK